MVLGTEASEGKVGLADGMASTVGLRAEPPTRSPGGRVPGGEAGGGFAPSLKLMTL